MRKLLFTTIAMAVTLLTYAQPVELLKSQKPANTPQSAQTIDRSIVDSLHYDGPFNSGIGTGSASSFGCYSYWPTESLSSYDGMVISQLKFYISSASDVSSGQIEVHHDQTSGAVYTQEFTAVEGWNVVDLDNPMQITSTQDFYIGYFIEVTGGYPAGVDAGPVASDGNGNWMLFSGSWDHLHNLGTGLDYNWNIRAMVADPADFDLAMKSVNLGGITTETEHTITGTLQNTGNTTITSFDINYQVDDGEVYTYSVTGESLATWDNYEFSHPDVWNADVGNYDVEVSISNINGTEDDNTANNSITKNVVVASGTTTLMPLYEEFTASTCPPCADFNSNVFTADYINDNSDIATVIKYQVNWPGSGDPYYTAEAGVRVGYYGVSAVPSLMIDGAGAPMGSTSNLQSHLNDQIEKPAYFDITATHQIDSFNETVNVNANITPYITDSDYVVHAVLFEYETTENAASNGETEFHHVMMKMIPDAQGTTMNFTAGETEMLTLSANLSETNIEEYNDLGVVVFIQNDANQQVFQSAYSTSGTMETHTLDFYVYSNNTPIDSALVSVSGLGEQYTDTTGHATWNELLATSGLTYTVTKSGIDSTATDTFDLTSDTTISINITGAIGINNNTHANFNIYPNPAEKICNVQFEGLYQVKIINTVGQIVYDKAIRDHAQIDLGNFTEGMYIISINNTEGTATRKLLIK